ncbi:hypothetical protein ACXWPH_10455, partial [Streptococcus pyogenes]
TNSTSGSFSATAGLDISGRRSPRIQAPEIQQLSIMSFFRRLPLWQVAAVLVALVAAAPVITLFVHALGGNTGHWSHLL